MKMKNKLSFTEKNNLVVKYTSPKYFVSDLYLFKKVFPSHQLYSELTRANPFVHERLDGQILFSLLDKINISEILNNRDSAFNEKVENHITDKKQSNQSFFPFLKKKAK